MFVLARKYGRLGNRLRRAAHLVAASIDHGHTLVDLSFSEYAADFEATRRDLFCRYPPARRALPAPRWIRALLDRLATLALRIARLVSPPGALLRAVVWRDVEVEYRLDAPAFRDLARRSRILLFEGWTFRTSAVERHAAAIRAHFTPARALAERAEAIAAGLRSKTEILVGVHLRRGDYDTWLGGRYHYPPSTYADLMRRVLTLFPGRRVLFLVCSNEPVPKDPFDGLPYALGTDHPVVDLYTLARCDYLLGPPSSFTLWASFAGDVPLWFVDRPEAEPSLEVFVRRTP